MNLKEKTVVIDNKTYRYSKIVMLLTNNPNYDPNNANVIGLHKNNYLQFCKGYDKEIETVYKPQHLYFLSTDKICEGDWYYTPIKRSIEQCVKQRLIIKGGENDIEQFKIIASTDPSLNLPKPSEQFLQVYIDCFNRKETIEECLVEYILVHDLRTQDKSKEFEYIPKITKGEITIRKVKESWSRKEIEQIIDDVLRIYRRDYLPFGEYPDYTIIECRKNFIEQNL